MMIIRNRDGAYFQDGSDQFNRPHFANCVTFLELILIDLTNRV